MKVRLNLQKRMNDQLEYKNTNFFSIIVLVRIQKVEEITAALFDQPIKEQVDDLGNIDEVQAELMEPIEQST